MSGVLQTDLKQKGYSAGFQAGYNEWRFWPYWKWTWTDAEMSSHRAEFEAAYQQGYAEGYEAGTDEKSRYG